GGFEEESASAGSGTCIAACSATAPAWR
ncbi:hypothetical protein EE612_015016, partial [Oryza sativa]